MTQAKTWQERRNAISEDISNLNDPEYFKKYPEIWDVAFDIENDSRYHRAIKLVAEKCVDAGRAELMKDVEGLVDVINKCSKFLNEDIAMLSCESRERFLSEDDWGTLMHYRDLFDMAIAKFKEVVE